MKHTFLCHIKGVHKRMSKLISHYVNARYVNFALIVQVKGPHKMTAISIDLRPMPLGNLLGNSAFLRPISLGNSAFLWPMTLENLQRKNFLNSAFLNSAFLRPVQRPVPLGNSAEHDAPAVARPVPLGILALLAANVHSNLLEALLRPTCGILAILEFLKCYSCSSAPNVANLRDLYLQCSNCPCGLPTKDPTPSLQCHCESEVH